MKKYYTKPVLMMEDFTLSQSIAHNCGKNLDFSLATLKYKGSCGWDLMWDGVVDKNVQDTDGDVLFLDGQNVCSFKTESFDGICYNNPAGGYNIFNS